MKRMHKIFALVLSFALLCSLPLAAHAQNSEGNILQFHNGSFKILILADLQDTDTPQKETIALMTAALDQTQPDLVVLLGVSRSRSCSATTTTRGFAATRSE